MTITNPPQHFATHLVLRLHCGVIKISFLYCVDEPGSSNSISPPDGKPQRYMQAMHPTKIILFVFLSVVFTLQFCRAKKDSPLDEVIITDEMAHPTDSVATINLIRDITNIPWVGRGPVGYAGTESNQPDYSHILAKTVGTNKLIELTNHKSPYVRLFTFEALCEKKYDGITHLFSIHITDTQTYKRFEGCIMTNEPVNVAFYKAIKSSITQSKSDSIRTILFNQNGHTLYDSLMIDF